MRHPGRQARQGAHVSRTSLPFLLPAPAQTTEHAHQHSLQQAAGGEFGVRWGVAPRRAVAERETDRPAYSGVSSSDLTYRELERLRYLLKANL